jgi:septal ring factor EnvC (AmiA/AmiB activator)
VDLYKAIRTLSDEKKRLDKLIESLEQMRARGNRERPAIRARRGRKRMTASERLEVSRRMKRYWAARRQQFEGGPAGQSALAVTPGPHA